jgi:nucleotidyltransferase substrate binding protein (TIGR01987 family)
MSHLDDVTQMAIKTGVIKNFEFTYELCWKFTRRWLRENALPEEADIPRTRKELFRTAARYRLIESPLSWFRYGDARNLTAHTYNEEVAFDIYATVSDFLKDAQKLLNNLEKRND